MAGCIAAFAIALSSCSSLPNPSRQHVPPGAEAARIMSLSAEKSGSLWKRYHRVNVEFAGEWSGMVKKLQPELVDAGFRGTSKETYFPRLNRVVQKHSGPAGVKDVIRTPDTILVKFNGLASDDKTANDAAALVADGYTMFLFGSDYLCARVKDWGLLPDERGHSIEGKPCWLVSGTLRPGLGRSSEDQVIAWVCKQDYRLLRVQFTLNGLESTQGADADVTFSEHRQVSGGAEIPHRFVETVRRPLSVKAHDWRLTSWSAE